MFKQTQKPQQGGYMQELNDWLDEHVISKLQAAFEEYAAAAEAEVPQAEAVAIVDPVVAEVKKSLRGKILESYHNGQAAGPRGGRRQYGSK